MVQDDRRGIRLLGRLLATSALLLLGMLCWSALPAFAQGSIDDVHIQPRTELRADTTALATLAMPSSGSNKPMKVFVDLVLVPVTIVDSMNRLVKGLSSSNFDVYEGKHQQDIRYFSSEDTPISVGVVLDLSGSMKSKIERAREAVVEFMNTANPQDEFFLITFADKPEEVSDFTSSIEDIQGKLVYTVPKGRTALLDAVRAFTKGELIRERKSMSGAVRQAMRSEKRSASDFGTSSPSTNDK